MGLPTGLGLWIFVRVWKSVFEVESVFDRAISGNTP